MRREGELNKGLKLVFTLLAIPDYVRGLDLNKKDRARLLKGLHSYQIAYLLGIETRKSSLPLSWLDPVREELQRHSEYPTFLRDKYEKKSRAQRARTVNLACTEQARMGVLNVVENMGPHHKIYKANEGIWNRESIETAKTTISKAHIGNCVSNGYVTLVNHNLLRESGFTVKRGFQDFPLKMCDQIRERIEGLLAGWVRDWEKKNKVSLDSLMDDYNDRSDSVIEKRNKKTLTYKECMAALQELGNEYAKRVPTFPLVVIDLNLDGWALALG